MSRHTKIIMLVAVLLSGCSSNKSATVPTPTNPENGNTTPITTSSSSALDPRLPKWVAAGIPVKLSDATQFSALEALAGSVTPPLVGDPLVALAIVSGTGTSITGDLGLSFEDKQGFWGAQWTVGSAYETGTYDGTHLNIVFSDSSMSIRIQGTVTSGNINATIYYRVRQSADTQCEAETVTCENAFGQPEPPSYCGNPPPPDVATPCLAYTDPSQSAVKPYGTFRTTYTNLTKPWEGQ